MTEGAIRQGNRLAVGSIGTMSNGYWGMIGLIATEGALFAYLLFSYYYHAVQPHGLAWPPGGIPSLNFSLPNTILFLLSSLVVWWGEHATKRGVRWKQLTGLTVGFLMGVGFVVIQALEWASKSFTLSSGAYGSLFFAVTGFHMAHIVLGLLLLFAVTVWSYLGYVSPVRSAPVSVAAIYWYFVNAVWLIVFFTLYLTPRLGLLWRAAQP
jgi:cytochrome c oxidase subunit III